MDEKEKKEDLNKVEEEHPVEETEETASDEETEKPDEDTVFEYKSADAESEPSGEGVDEETPEEKEERMKFLEEAKRQHDEIKEEDFHPDYKRLVGLAPVESTFREEEGVMMGFCEGCGKRVPASELEDNGNFLACKECI